MKEGAIGRWADESDIPIGEEERGECLSCT